MKYARLTRIFLIAGALLLTTDRTRAQESGKVYPLWPNGAPGSESRKDEPETKGDWWVANVHNPTLTAFIPEPEKRNGTALIICPGGGHSKLVFTAEGTDTAKYLMERGFSCFVLKYRLGREENSGYAIDKQGYADGLRAVRYVRHHASQWNLDPSRIGMFGFSAGGEVVSMVTFQEPATIADGDKVDATDGQVNFQIQVYPGPLGIPESLPSKLPPAFFVVAGDDGATKNIVRMVNGYSQAKQPFEVHIYQRGGHGFNMGQRSKQKSIATWPERLVDWLNDNIVANAPKDK